ncbi:MAG: hypothetical protein NT084_14325 [Bacteroidetes bacterium]|jgi:hypothetical protein|nr:hypothetical protein [Bacteroidota bacterium]
MKSEVAKLELIEWLAKIEDKGMLSSLLFLKKSSESFDWADQLTIDQRNRVEEGLEDIEKGRTLSNEKVWKKYGRKA